MFPAIPGQPWATLWSKWGVLGGWGGDDDTPICHLQEPLVLILVPPSHHSLCRAPSNRVKGIPFRPVKAVAVDLFPQTPHCEMLILFERMEQHPNGIGALGHQDSQTPRNPPDATPKETETSLSSEVLGTAEVQNKS